MGYRGVLAALVLALAGVATTAGAEPFTLREALAYPFVDLLRRRSKATASPGCGWSGACATSGWPTRPAYTPRQVTQFTADDGQELTQPDLLARRRAWSACAAATTTPTGRPRATSRPTRPPARTSPSDDLARRPRAPGRRSRSPRATRRRSRPRACWPSSRTSRCGPRRWTADAKPSGCSSTAARTANCLVAGRQAAGLRLRPRATTPSSASSGADQPLAYLAPSTSLDAAPAGRRTASGSPSRAGRAGAARRSPILKRDAATLVDLGRRCRDRRRTQVWQSPATLRGSYPEVAGEANLLWAGGDRLVFLAELDNWPHLYSVADSGGAARLLTPGAFMVEHVGLSAATGRDRSIRANTGAAPNDGDRRHLFRVAVDGRRAAAAHQRREHRMDTGRRRRPPVAFIAAGAQSAAPVDRRSCTASGARKTLAARRAGRLPGAQFVVAEIGDLHRAGRPDRSMASSSRPAGARQEARPDLRPRRAAPADAARLALHGLLQPRLCDEPVSAAHGFVVLSVNYRLGIGYGHAFQHPDTGRAAGRVRVSGRAGGRALSCRPDQGVDPDAHRHLGRLLRRAT